MGETAADAFVREAQERAARWRLAGQIAATVALVGSVSVVLFVECNGVPAGDRRVLDALTAAGLRRVELGGSALAQCETAESSRRFTARNAAGDLVRGAVCCGITGMVKGCVIRWGDLAPAQHAPARGTRRDDR